MNSTPTTFIQACRGQPTPFRPIWLMRQAGRYMKEYRDLRAKVSFLELCRSPELVCEVTVHACRTIQADAAIIFADILLIAEALGFDLEFAKNHGPIIHNPFQSNQNLSMLGTAKITEKLQYVFDAIRMTRKELEPKYSLIGFAGAPFTVATYAIEGGKSKDFAKVKNIMKHDPVGWNGLLSALTQATIEYLNGQVQAGADCLQIFDSWIGLLKEDEYEKYVYPHMQKLFAGIDRSVPIIHFGTKTKHLLHKMKEAGGDVLGLDTDVSIREFWPEISYQPIQGNLDPEILLKDIPTIQREAQKILDEVGDRPGFIFNLGHGILPSTPVDNVKALINYVHESSKR